MPDQPFDQTDFSDQIAQRRAERHGMPPARPAPDPRIDALMGRVTVLEGFIQNLQGANGISVNGNVISWTDPSPVAPSQRTITATGTIDCDADPPTVTITING